MVRKPVTVLAAVVMCAVFDQKPASAQFAERYSLADVNILAATLLNGPLPEDAISINQQLTRADDLLISLARRAHDIEARSKALDEFEKNRQAMVALINRAASVNCDNTAAVQSLYAEFSALAQFFSDSTTGVNDVDRLVSRATEGSFSSAASRCAAIKQIRLEDMQQALQSLSDTVSADREAVIAEKRQADDLTSRINTRKQELQKALQSAEDRQGVFRDLWKIILVVGLLSLAAMFGLRWLPGDIQLEWVRSGQVIQFVTVMILLSVIMALGLTEVLKENVLGTLLGGVAGYVLSQGVGKAAAQEVARQRREPGAMRPFGLQGQPDTPSTS